MNESHHQAGSEVERRVKENPKSAPGSGLVTCSLTKHPLHSYFYQPAKNNSNLKWAQRLELMQHYVYERPGGRFKYSGGEQTERVRFIQGERGRKRAVERHRGREKEAVWAE